MALLSLIDVWKAYDAERPLLEGASFMVRDDDRIGLIGPNGAGKSTLLRLLAGLETPEQGERVVRRGLRIGYLEQEPRFAAGATVREVVREGLGARDELLEEIESVHAELARADLAESELERLLRRQTTLQDRLEELGGHDVEHKIDATIDGVGLADPDAPCESLSGGEARRAALARLLVSAPDVFLLDEPTNHLDAFVIAWLEARLTELRAPLVLVTHDRYLLDRVARRIVEVDRGKLYESEGGYGRYLRAREERLRSAERDERARLSVLRRETAWMQRGPLARTSKSKSRIQRYEDLVASAPDRPQAELELAIPAGPRLGSKVVELAGVGHRYGSRDVLEGVDLELTGDMCLGVVGSNGAGKTTLLRILTGDLVPASGSVVRGDTVRFAAIDQRRSDLDPEKTVVQEVAGDSDHVGIAGSSVHVAGFLDRFLFPGARKNVLVGKLSGGERGRILLAKLLLAGGNVLILDEPTNDLDLATLRALEEAILAFPGAVIVVSHDRWFLDRVATHVLHLDGTGHARLHPGDASSLLERVAEEGRAARSASQGSIGRSSGRPKSGAGVGLTVSSEGAAAPAASAASQVGKRLSNWEEKELEGLTARITELEAVQGELDAQLADPAIYRDAEALRGVQAEREKAGAELTAALARWEELAERA